MKKLFGGSCLLFVMLCGAGSFAALFIGSIIFGQVQAEVKNATATVVSQQTPTQLQAKPSQLAPGAASIDSSSQSSDIQVSVESDNGSSSGQGEVNNVVSTSTPTPAPFVTNTPGLPPLGTLSYPMTVTAEYILEQTKVSDFRNQIGLTETAMAQESISIFATLTAGAPKRGK